jgi:hypothetical protein
MQAPPNRTLFACAVVWLAGCSSGKPSMPADVDTGETIDAGETIDVSDESSTAMDMQPESDLATLPSSTFTKVFSDDFETYTAGLPLPFMNGWQQVDSRNGPIVVSSSADGKQGPHAGTKMLQMNWNGTVPWYDANSVLTTAVSWPYTKEFLIRFWFRIDSNHDVYTIGTTSGYGCKAYRITGLQSDGTAINDHFGGAQKSDDGLSVVSGIAECFMPHNREDPKTCYWGGAPGDATLSNNSVWHKIEIYVYVDGKNGIGRAWHDGILVKEWKGYDTHGQWAPFHTASNWDGAPNRVHDAVNSSYMDGVEIFSDATTGSPATGNMADATAQ